MIFLLVNHFRVDFWLKPVYIFDGVAAADEDAGEDLVTVTLHAQPLRLVQHPARFKGTGSREIRWVNMMTVVRPDRGLFSF